MKPYKPLEGNTEPQVQFTTTGYWAVRIGSEWVPILVSYPVVRATESSPHEPIQEETRIRPEEYISVCNDAKIHGKEPNKYPLAFLLPLALVLPVPYKNWSPGMPTLTTFDRKLIQNFHYNDWTQSPHSIKDGLLHNVNEYYSARLKDHIGQYTHLWFIHTILLLAKRRFPEKVFQSIVDHANAQLFVDQILWENLHE